MQEEKKDVDSLIVHTYICAKLFTNKFTSYTSVFLEKTFCSEGLSIGRAEEEYYNNMLMYYNNF